MNGLLKPLLAAAFGLLVSCGTSMNKMAGYGVVKSNTAEFDGSQIVEATPNYTANFDGRYSPFRLGARWTDSLPDAIAITVKFEGLGGLYGDHYKNLSAMWVNIEGQVHKFEMTGLTRHDSRSSRSGSSLTIQTESQNRVIVGRDLFERMIASPDVKLRILTIHEYQDIDFSRESAMGSALAVVTFREFLQKIADLEAEQ